MPPHARRSHPKRPCFLFRYDNDDSGSVDEQEFALIMVNQFCSTALPRGAVVEKASGRPHRLLRSGRCRIVVRYECSLPSRFDLGDDTGFLSIIHSIEVAETEHEKLGIFRQVGLPAILTLSVLTATCLIDPIPTPLTWVDVCAGNIIALLLF